MMGFRGTGVENPVPEVASCQDGQVCRWADHLCLLADHQEDTDDSPQRCRRNPARPLQTAVGASVDSRDGFHQSTRPAQTCVHSHNAGSAQSQPVKTCIPGHRSLADFLPMLRLKFKCLWCFLQLLCDCQPLRTPAAAVFWCQLLQTLLAVLSEGPQVRVSTYRKCCCELSL